MKKVVVRVFISLCLVLSLALTSTSLSLSFYASNKDGASSSETNGLSTAGAVYSNMDEEGAGSLDVEEIKNESIWNEVYTQMQFVPSLPLGANEYKTDRFIVKFKNTSGRASLANSLGGDLKAIRYFKNSKFRSFNVIMTKTKMNKEDFMAKVLSNNAGGEIVYIQPDYELSAAALEADTTAERQEESSDGGQDQLEEESLPEFLTGLPPNDPMLELWQESQKPKKDAPKRTNDDGTPVDRADVNIKEAWEKSKGEGTIVAIMDTGIDITHKEISQNIWTNKAETPGNGIDDDGNGYIDDANGWNFCNNNNEVHRQGLEYDEWHGTHLAGIIAGVAPESKIMPLQVFKNGTAYTSDIIEAIDYAEKNGAKIANCSWGTSADNLALKEAIAQSAMLFVCATGNSNSDIDINPVYPASYRMNNIVTVASLNKDGVLSGYSNYGEVSVDVAAPGENIISTIPGDGHGMSSGTSQSAAFVAGEAALVLGEYKNANALGIKQTIIESSDKQSGLVKQVLSGNKINCGSAVSSTIPEIREKIRENNEDMSVSDYVYEEISVTDSVYGETTVTRTVYGNTAAWDSVYQPADVYSLYSGELWNIKASMPTARSGLAAAKVNGKIYTIGGYSNNGISDTVEEYDPATNTWMTKASMPTSRYGLAAAAVNGKIYAIGGYNNQHLNTVEEYDPATNTWTTKASMSTPRFLLAAAVASGKIYAIGGNNSIDFLNTIEEYDPLTNTWTTKATMTTPRNYLAVAVVNGEIYAIGGFYNNNSLNIVEKYDPVTNTWTTKTGMPMPRFGLSAAAANGKIYTMGGLYHYDGDYLNVVQEYNPATNMWTTIASMPTSRHLMAASAIGNRVYAIGGNGVNNLLNTVEELVLGTDDYGNDFADSTPIEIGLTVEGWIDYYGDEDVFGFSPALSGPYVIESSGAMDMYGELYDSDQNWLKSDDDSGDNYNFRIAVNLQAGQTYYLKVWNYEGAGPYEIVISQLPNNLLASSPDSSTITVLWDPVPDATGYDIEVDGTVINNGSSTTYIHSGLSRDIVYKYRVRAKYVDTAGGWSRKAYALTQGSYHRLVSAMPTPRYGLVMVEVNGKLYVIGGFNEDNYFLNTVEEYDPATDTWTTKASMPTARYGLVAAAVNGKIYAIGGYNNQYLNTVEEYDPTTDTWTKKADMPSARYGLAAAVVNEKIYVTGGYKNGYLQTMEEYDPATNTWTAKATMPTGRTNLAAAAVNNKIYVIGGFNSQTLSKVEEYDPATNTWAVLTNMPTARHGLGAVALNSKLYAIGGNYYLNTIEEYDSATNSWSTKLGMPIESRLLGAAALNGKVYVIGGYNSDGYLDCVQELTIMLATNYFYDSLNRLNTIFTPEKIINYQYDGNGNLIQRTIN